MTTKYYFNIKLLCLSLFPYEVFMPLIFFLMKVLCTSLFYYEVSMDLCLVNRILSLLSGVE